MRLARLLILTSLGACGRQASAPQPLDPGLRDVARAAEERRYDAAQALARRFLATHPDHAQGVFLLGMTYYWMGNYGAARPWFERARELELDNVALYDVLGYSLFLLGDLAGARREYEAYRALRPKEPKAHYGLGLIELDETRLAEAQACFECAIALFDELGEREPRQAEARVAERAECHARLAEVHFALGDYAAARSGLERATALAPGNISAFHTLSLVYRRLGDEAGAERALARYESARAALVRSQPSTR